MGFSLLFAGPGRPRTMFARLLVVLLLLVAGSACHATRAAEGPTPYPSAEDQAAWPGDGPIRVFEWMMPFRERFWSERASAQGAVVLVGDSLAEYWGETGYGDAFGELPVVNRGIGGDVTRGVLFRLQEDVLDIQPKAVVLLVGMNDLTAHSDPETVAKNIALALDQLSEHTAEMPILLCTIPAQSNPDAPFKTVDALDRTNAAIRQLAKERDNVTLVELYEALLDANGHQQLDFYRDDRLHLASKGYERANRALADAAKVAGLVQPRP